MKAMRWDWYSSRLGRTATSRTRADDFPVTQARGRQEGVPSEEADGKIEACAMGKKPKVADEEDKTPQTYLFEEQWPKSLRRKILEAKSMMM